MHTIFRRRGPALAVRALRPLASAFVHMAVRPVTSVMQGGLPLAPREVTMDERRLRARPCRLQVIRALRRRSPGPGSQCYSVAVLPDLLGAHVAVDQ